MTMSRTATPMTPMIRVTAPEEPMFELRSFCDAKNPRNYACVVGCRLHWQCGILHVLYLGWVCLFCTVTPKKHLNGIKNKARCQLSKLQFESFRIVLHKVASIYHLTKHCRVRAMIHCNYFECFEYLWNNSPEVIQQFENKGKFMRIFQRKSLKDFWYHRGGKLFTTAYNWSSSDLQVSSTSLLLCPVLFKHGFDK